MAKETAITPEDLELNISSIEVDAVQSLREVRHTIEKQKLIEAMRHCNNNISKVARILGISRPSVYSLKKKYKV